MRSLMLICVVAAAAARPQLVSTSRSERWERTRDRHAKHRKLVLERPLLRWAEWPHAASPADLPTTYGELLDKRQDQLNAAITLYGCFMITLHTFCGNLIDQIQGPFGWCFGAGYVVVVLDCLKSLALRLLNLAIHPEDFRTLWRKVLSGLLLTLVFTLCAWNQGGIYKEFVSMSSFGAKVLATRFDLHMTCLGLMWLGSLATYEILRFRAERIIAWITSAAGSCVDPLAMGLVLMGEFVVASAFGAAVRSKVPSPYGQLLAGFLSIGLGIGVAYAHHLLFFRKYLRRFPRPEFWPAWLPWY